MRPLPRKILILAALALGTTGVARAQAPDDAAIRAVETAQEAAWNAHDAHAFAQLFAPDADLVSVLGWWWKSRDEIERKLSAAFAFVYARSLLHIDDVTVRPLSPDLALAHVVWSESGARAPDGSSIGPKHGIQSQVLRKTDGRWLILSYQNGIGAPEIPLPTVAPPVKHCLLANRDGKCLIQH